MLDSKELRSNIEAYLKYVLAQNGWMKAVYHEKICDAITQELKIDGCLNFDLVRTYTREDLTNQLNIIGLRFRKYEQKEFTVLVSKFVKHLEAMLPKIEALSYEKTGKDCCEEDVWRMFHGTNGIGVKK